MNVGFNTVKRIFSPNSLFRGSLRFLTNYAVTYKSNGDPLSVLELVESNISEELSPNNVLVKMLAAPINPADINMIQGKYALKPELPAIGGNEGVGEVLKVGTSVTKLKVGDRVIPNSAGTGTWRTHSVASEDAFLVVDHNLPLLSAATISVNPCTAYRMLKDFVHLKEGSTVIQNGANSGVGQAVIQICKFLNINTVNVIRERPDLQSLKDQLQSLGATYVVTDTELRMKIMEDIFKNIPRASLALNCVGGKQAAELTRHMVPASTMVTYGGMSKQPLTISTASLIFNDIRYHGFWMTRWNSEKTNEKRTEMLEKVSSMITSGHLTHPSCEETKLKYFKMAVEKSMESFVSKKQILVMD